MQTNKQSAISIGLSAKMRSISIFIFALIYSVNIFSITPDSLVKRKVYHVNYPVVGSIIGIGMTSDVFAINRIKGKSKISDEELQFLNSDAQRNNINSIDRWALKQNVSGRDTYKKVSDYGMVPIILLPGFLAFDKDIRKDWLDLLMIYAEGHVITFTFYNYSFLGPTFQNRYRPMTYYSEYTDAERESGNNRNSFYSGHVATCAYSTFFMAKVWCDYHPNNGAGKYFAYALATIPPVVMGYARVRALDHFPSDDLVGFALGAAIGIIVPELHKNHFNKNLRLGMYTTPDATGLSVNWTLPNK